MTRYSPILHHSCGRFFGAKIWRLAFLVLVEVGAFATGGARAEDEKPRLLFTDQPGRDDSDFVEPHQRSWSLLNSPADDPGRIWGALWLRPNTPQNVFFFVDNPLPVEKRCQVKVTGAAEYTSDEILVPAGKRKQVKFGKPKPPGAAPAAPAADPAKKEPPPGDPLAGPPFSLQVALIVDGAEIERREVPLGILTPQDYLQAEARYNNSQKELSVTVRPAASFGGEPVKIELRVSVDEGTAPVAPAGNKKVITATVPPKAQGVGLVRATEPFGPTLPERGKGYVYVTADGYERAFIFRADFLQTRQSGDLLLEPDLVPRAFIEAARYTNTADSYSVSFGLENFHPQLDPKSHRIEDVKLELTLGDNRGNALPGAEKVSRVGHRKQEIRVETGGPGGSLVLHSALENWTLKRDLSLLAGTDFQWQLRVRDLDDREIATLGIGTRDVTIVSEIKPKVTFGDLPDQIVMGGDLAIKAKVESVPPAKHVYFFLIEKGAPVPDEKEILKGVKAQPAGNNEFEQSLVAPAKKGKYQVLALLTTAAGSARSRPEDLEVIDPKEVTKKGALIIGKATDEAGTVLPRVIVGLLVADDPKMPKRDEAETDTKGEFSFTDVPKGNYKLTFRDPNRGWKAEADVSVVEEQGKLVAKAPKVTAVLK